MGIVTTTGDHRRRIRALERRLSIGSAPGQLTEDELDTLPEAARRYFAHAMAPGAPLAQAARVRMRGQLKLGARWLPFRAHEVLAPRAGFVWAARVAGLVTGSDHYVDADGALDWKLLGLIRVMHASGPDVARSAAGRGAAEGVWVPSALLPRFGVDWSSETDDHIVANYRIDDVDLELHCRLDAEGRLRSITFDRWGDPDETGSYGQHPFGVEVTGYDAFGPYAVPSAGRAGWFPHSDRWPESVFFRYQLTHYQPVP
jgi:hypothetical protein